ncbi:MAG: DUF2280 domain-containing protein [Rhizobiaceae bacterium]
MARLEDHHKQFIVENLADFRGYADIARLMKEEWGIEVDRAQVRSYDPSKPAYAGGDKWRGIFEARRKAYLGSFEEVPIASEAFRMRQLHEFFIRAKDSGNTGLSLKILKQVDEMTSKISAKNPQNMIPRPDWYDLTPDERRSKATEFLRELLTRQGALDENGRIKVPVN